MIIYFNNKTVDSLVLELNQEKILLKSGDKIKTDSETNKIKFNCYLNECSKFKYLPLSKSVIIEYSFILNSFYDVVFNQQVCEIDFIKKRVKGNNLDCYTFIDLQLNGGNINSKEFCVLDEISAKSQLLTIHKKEAKLEKKLKIVDIIQTVCYIGIPALIIFAGIWYFVDIKTALCILIPLTILAVAIGLLLKKAINRFNNKLDKINSKFQKANVEFDGVNSFLDKNYIRNVLNNNQE